MVEHRPDTGDRQDGGSAAGQSRRDIGETDYVRHRPRRPRSEVRHRLAQAQARTGLAAQPAVRGRNRNNCPMVSRIPIFDGRHNFWRVSAILSEHV